MTSAYPSAHALRSAPQVLGEAAIERSRVVALAVARALEDAKAPSHRFAEAGLRLNAAIHSGLARLVSNQVRVLDGLMDDGARRLERAARAEGLRPLFAEQIDLIAGTRERLVNDARRTLEILADTRTELAKAFVAPRATASPSTKGRGKAATTRKTPARGKKRTGRRKAR